MDRALVIGLGMAGTSVARQLLRRGVGVVVLDDRPTDAAHGTAAELGVEYVSDVDVATLVAACDVVSPSPGVPVGHAAIQAALTTGVPVWSEFELAAMWDARPVVAITGTNGKTTVVTLVESMLAASGHAVVAAGNNELPLVDAIDDGAVELFVVEASSFRLQFTERFRPRVGTWLNLAPDHLDWHPSMEEYAAAKARLWAAQRDGDIAIGNADDPAVLHHLAAAPARQTTFAVPSTDADWRVAGGAITGPAGDAIVAVDDLPRRLPHDLANAVAAVATAMSAGAAAGACAGVLRSITGLPHRVALVRDAGGVRWYDDSKATTPASVVTAVSAFDSVVLIAGGRNKGLDLGVLRSLADRIHAVVAIGEAAPLVSDAFDGEVPVVVAPSMDAAVAAAADLARPGDAVLLSPGCASYDWYRNYAERGDDFARAVHALVGGDAP